jgi:hypothetical protein
MRALRSESIEVLAGGGARVGGAEADPFAEVGDYGVGEFAVGRHFDRRVGVGDSLEEQAVGGVTGEDSVATGAAALEGGGGVDGEAAGGFGGGVAAVAVSGEDGADAGFEEIRLGPGQGREREGEKSGKAHGETLWGIVSERRGALGTLAKGGGPRFLMSSSC